MKQIKTIGKTIGMVAALAVSGQALAGIQVSQVGSDNAMVRITDPLRYLILPVQESMPDAKVEVLVDGNIVDTFYVRLADNSVDYTVPFDLSPYSKNGEILLNVITEVDRAHARDVSDYLCWGKMSMADSFDTTNREKYRPVYHHTPLYGWMNDPNGMFYKDGVWHLYYQYNPYGSKWQNMSWGHSTSTDLVNWEHHPVALTPDGLGSIFSGSSVVDHNNTAGFGKDAVIALFTSAGKNQLQSMAVSHDNGETFGKYPGNPVIMNPMEARDPNMFWHEPTQKWVLVLAEALNKQMQVYTSPDLVHWTYESAFGKGYGAQDGVWECPDLFQLPVEGSKEKKWVLVCNINPGGPFGGSATQYFVGDFDGTTFTTKTPPSVTKWMDYGKDHYATVSWSDAPDNRRVVIGWMSNWQYANEVPTMQFRSANTIARDLGLFKGDDGEYYLSVKPSPELQAMRGECTSADNISLNGDRTSIYTMSLPSRNDGACEIVVDYDIKTAKQFDIVLRNPEGDEVVMTVDPLRREFAMDREKSGLSDFSRHFAAKTVAPMHTNKNKGQLRIFVDRCSVEAFDSNGRFAMTNLVFPTSPYNEVLLKARGGKVQVPSVKIYSVSINN